MWKKRVVNTDWFYETRQKKSYQLFILQTCNYYVLYRDFMNTLYYTGTRLEKLKKTKKDHQGNVSRSRDLNPRPPEGG